MTAPVRFMAAQLRVLTALCAPTLTRPALGAVAATYAPIAERLGLRPNYGRYLLKATREALAGHSFHRLTADNEPGDGAGDDVRAALARSALRQGWVGERDIAELPPRPEPVR